MANIKVTPEESILISMAVRHWVERCKNEAAIMKKWQAEYAEKDNTELAEKCGRNADASLRFQAEAEELYAKLIRL